MFIGRHHERLALAAGDGDRGDIPGMPARVIPALAAQGEGVLSGARDPEFLSHVLGGFGHRLDAVFRRDPGMDEAPADGLMDDLNHDGRSDEADVELLAAIADGMDADSAAADVSGGLGRYAANDRHGPFIHVDVRNIRARW
jgi:hypothetical protein